MQKYFREPTNFTKHNCHHIMHPRGVNRGRGQGGQSPPEFGRSVNPIQTRGADYAPYTTASPPDSKSYLQIWNSQGRRRTGHFFSGGRIYVFNIDHIPVNSVVGIFSEFLKHGHEFLFGLFLFGSTLLSIFFLDFNHIFIEKGFPFTRFFNALESVLFAKFVSKFAVSCPGRQFWFG